MDVFLFNCTMTNILIYNQLFVDTKLWQCSMRQTRLNASLVTFFLDCVSMSTTRVENYKLEGFVFVHYHVKHVGDCGMKCFADNRCLSFNFISFSMSCELNSATEYFGSENLKPALGVTYFYRNVWWSNMQVDGVNAKLSWHISNFGLLESVYFPLVWTAV